MYAKPQDSPITQFGYGGAWDLPMPAPRIVGQLPRDDFVGLRAGSIYIGRLARDPNMAGNPELLDTLIVRAARQCGTDDVFELVYL